MARGEWCPRRQPWSGLPIRGHGRVQPDRRPPKPMLRSSCRAAAASGTWPSPAPPPDASEAHLREDQRAEPGRTGAAPALGRPRFARRPL